MVNQRSYNYLINVYIIILGRKGKNVIEPPAVWLRYNCILKTGLLCVEWINLSNIVEFAFMYIVNFKSNDEDQYKWHWQEKNIIKMKKKLQANAKYLKAFTHDASKTKDYNLDLMILNIFLYIYQ